VSPAPVSAWRPPPAALPDVPRNNNPPSRPGGGQAPVGALPVARAGAAACAAAAVCLAPTHGAPAALCFGLGVQSAPSFPLRSSTASRVNGAPPSQIHPPVSTWLQSRPSVLSSDVSFFAVHVTTPTRGRVWMGGSRPDGCGTQAACATRSAGLTAGDAVCWEAERRGRVKGRLAPRGRRMQAVVAAGGIRRSLHSVFGVGAGSVRAGRPSIIFSGPGRCAGRAPRGPRRRGARRTPRSALAGRNLESGGRGP
jgi:hypothetical protein